MLHHTTFETSIHVYHWPSAKHLWNVVLEESLISQSRPCSWIQHPKWSWKNNPILSNQISRLGFVCLTGRNVVPWPRKDDACLAKSQSWLLSKLKYIEGNFCSKTFFIETQLNLLFTLQSSTKGFLLPNVYNTSD